MDWMMEKPSQGKIGVGRERDLNKGKWKGAPFTHFDFFGLKTKRFMKKSYEAWKKFPSAFPVFALVSKRISECH